MKLFQNFSFEGFSYPYGKNRSIAIAGISRFQRPVGLKKGS
jgi:hypothetical protein